MSAAQRDVLANPNVPLARAHGIAMYTDLANTTMRTLLSGYTPHPLTPAEIEKVHRQTVREIIGVRRLEAIHDAVRKPHPVEKDLFVARVRYRTIFCRTFRINDLPDEVLTDVFRFTVWTGPSPAVSNNWRLWLTWVCRKWRKMVIEDATVWNAIWFRDRYPFVRSWVWFERACSTPLDIRITDSVEDPYDAIMMKEMLDRIFTKIRQLRLFIVIVEAWEPALIALDWLQKIAKSSIPMILDRFEVHRTGPNYIRIESDPQLREYHTPIPLFGGANLPSFRSFSLNGIHIDWHKTQISNLTTLDLRRMPLTRAPDLSIFRTILRTSPNLYRLCLDGAGPKWEVEDELDPIDLPNLKRLICANFSFEYAMFILRQLNAPNVVDLHLFNFVGEDYTPLVEFLTGRCNEVRILTIYAVELTFNPSILDWLESMPKMMYLRVGHMQMFFLNFFLQNVTPVLLPGTCIVVPEPLIVCPQLCFLELNNGVDAAQAMAWINHRVQMGCPLQKVYITKTLSLTLSEEDHATFMKICSFYRLEVGATPPEEEWILSL